MYLIICNLHKHVPKYVFKNKIPLLDTFIWLHFTLIYVIRNYQYKQYSKKLIDCLLFSKALLSRVQIITMEDMRVFLPDGKRMVFSLQCREKACLIWVGSIEFILSGVTFYLSIISCVVYKCIIIIIIIFLSFQGCTHGIWRFSGQGSNWSYSCRPTPQLQQCRI